ncbi:Inhibitor of growth protein 1 [Melipona quadrifasciata]|uniref:Inhibitor of growth protein 1 n=1 Tax=Melipona quadrifasciata TaxID=166423 RepID=A0A0M8ZPF4_9HYME|nr:Inhibitor of growth protein 1 [Melipona quadrifasciata]
MCFGRGIKSATMTNHRWSTVVKTRSLRSGKTAAVVRSTEYENVLGPFSSSLVNHGYRLRLGLRRAGKLGEKVTIDIKLIAYLREVDQQQEALRNDTDLAIKRRALLRVQQALIAAQEIGDEKLQIVQQVQDLIENKSRQLDLDYRNLDFGKEQESSESVRETNANVNSNSSGNANNSERQPKRARRTRTETIVESSNTMDMIVMAETRSNSLSNASNGNQKKTTTANTGKKKKRKSRQGLLKPNHNEQNEIYILLMFTDKDHMMHNTFSYHSSALHFLYVSNVVSIK